MYFDLVLYRRRNELISREFNASNGNRDVVLFKNFDKVTKMSRIYFTLRIVMTNSNSTLCRVGTVM